MTDVIDTPLTVPTLAVEMYDLAADLVSVQRAIKTLQDDALAPLVTRQSEIRDALCQQMAEQGVKTIEAAGMQFQRRVTRSLEITDDAEFIAALSEAGMLDDCLRLDRTAAKKAARGREMPGTQMVAREVFAVTAKGNEEKMN